MKITLENILSITKKIKFKKDPSIPFPQADSFNGVISLLEMLNTDNLKSKEKLTYEFKFDPRQTDYYFNAGKYLGFLEDDKIQIEEDGRIIKKSALKLSTKGQELFNMSYKNRQLEYAKAILEHKVFNDVFKEYLRTNEIPRKSKIVEYMKNAKLHNIGSDETYRRRASTVFSWIEWIISLYS